MAADAAFCRRMKGRDLDEYQAGDDSHDECHHGGCYRNSGRKHPISSARPPPPAGKKKIGV
jgi:hypothetical protein